MAQCGFSRTFLRAVAHSAEGAFIISLSHRAPSPSPPSAPHSAAVKVAVRSSRAASFRFCRNQISKSHHLLHVPHTLYCCFVCKVIIELLIYHLCDCLGVTVIKMNRFNNPHAPKSWRGDLHHVHNCRAGCPTVVLVCSHLPVCNSDVSWGYK